MSGEYRNQVENSLEKIEEDIKKALNVLISIEDSEDITEVKESVNESILLLSGLIDKL